MVLFILCQRFQGGNHQWSSYRVGDETVITYETFAFTRVVARGSSANCSTKRRRVKPLTFDVKLRICHFKGESIFEPRTPKLRFEHF